MGKGSGCSPGGLPLGATTVSTPAESLAVLRTQANARKREEFRAGYKWQVERIWRGVSLAHVQTAYREDGTFLPLTVSGRIAARQLRRSMIDATRCSPYRLLITLEGGEIASCLCMVPPHWRADPLYLASEAERVAVAHVARCMPAALQWWQE